MKRRVEINEDIALEVMPGEKYLRDTGAPERIIKDLRKTKKKWVLIKITPGWSRIESMHTSEKSAINAMKKLKLQIQKDLERAKRIHKIWKKK